MHVIYEPKGAAREYSPLACNLYFGCTHGCTYCFAPACMRKTMDDWHSKGIARKDVIELFRKDARKLADTGDSREILFSFLSDPYQPLEDTEHLTHQALTILKEFGLHGQILTKGFGERVSKDFDLMLDTRTNLGMTLTFSDDTTRQLWEPHAAPVADRLETLRRAHEYGIKTWVSLEPVIIPEQALQLLRQAFDFVDVWKIGKINHDKRFNNPAMWKQFNADVRTFFENRNADNYILKESLLKYD